MFHTPGLQSQPPATQSLVLMHAPREGASSWLCLCLSGLQTLPSSDLPTTHVAWPTQLSDPVGVGVYPEDLRHTHWNCLSGKPILRTIFLGDKRRFALISKTRREGVIREQGTCGMTVSSISRESCKHTGDFSLRVDAGHEHPHSSRVSVMS